MLIRVLGTLAVGALLVGCQRYLAQQSAKPLSSLAGTEWGPADNPHDQFIQFRTGGEVSGHAGCNRFFGSYAQDGDSTAPIGTPLTFGPLASTKMACPGPQMQAERAWLAMLGDVRSAEATFKELILRSESGAELARLRRRDFD